jgi:predicted RecB family nuclease
MGSMEYYDQYLNALEEDKEAAENLKRQVIAYNQDDCASTLALTRWLRSLVNRDV